MLLPVAAVHAQAPLSEAEQATSSYAFAWLLGAGVYDVDGRAVQVYRLPLRWRLREASGRRAALDLTLPVTAGFYDFRLRDVIGSGLPRQLSTLSVVPGLRWERRLSDAWVLRPHVEAGVARADTQDAWVAGAGLEAEHIAQRASGRWRAETSLRAAFVDFAGRPLDDLWLLEQGAELTRSTELRLAGRRLDVAPYAVLRAYLDPPAAPLLPTGAAGAAPRLQLELGVTFGTVEPLRIGRITLPRVGIGWRAGDDLSLLRVVIGTPF
jgi:hypothetical protein